MQPIATDKQLSICFYGSSDEGLDSPLAVLHKQDIEKIVLMVLDLEFNSFQIITGGYGGIMDLVAQEFKKQSKDKNKAVQIVGVTCDAYELEDPENSNRTYNKSNDYSLANDIVIQAESFPARIQSMIELSDVFVVLPGKQGTLSEFLITAEAYAYPINTLKEKNYKILVYDTWKSLLMEDTFRKFKNIEYFNVSDFANKLKVFSPSSKRNLSESYPIDDIPDAFKKLWQDLEVILYGKVFSDPKLKKRLKYKTNILSIDFGWYLFSGSTTNEGGEYLTYSTSKYKEILANFFAGKNSIMFNEENKDSEYKIVYLKGELSEDEIEEDIITPLTPNPINKPDQNKVSAKFHDWASFLEKDNKYGQTLIWRSIKNTNKNNGSQKENFYELNLSIFLLFNCYLPSRKIEKIRQRVDGFFASASSKKISELFERKEEELQKQATRAAISQVMARNTSHNIGAHVMNKLINEKYLETFCSYVKTHASCEKEHLKSYQPDKDYIDNNEDHQPFNQIAIFNNYIKCRMDYLADISFGTPMMQTNKYVWQDLFGELDKVRLLLEHISGLSDFKYKIEFRKNGKRFKASKIDESDNEATEDDLLVAIPNDILGTQAFYNILENIIRNTAKHSDKSKLDKDVPVIFIVNFIDDIEYIKGLEEYENDNNRIAEITNILNDNIAVAIYDNIPVMSEDKFKLSDEEKEAAYKQDVKLSSDIDRLVFKQNFKLNEDILKDNKLRSSSLGLIEMDASATYLRKRDVSFINHPNYDIVYDNSWSSNSIASKKDPCKRGTDCRNFLKAFNKINHLAYRFFLLRPALVLIVTDELKDNESKKNELKKQGVWIETKQQCHEHLKNGKVYNHEFVLLGSADFKEFGKGIFKKYKTSLPIRILGDVDIQQVLKKKILQEFEKFCWQEWYRELKTLYGVNDEIYLVNSIYCNTSKDQNFNAIFLDHGKQDWSKYNCCANVDYLDDLSTKAQEKLPEIKKKTANFKKYISNLYDPGFEIERYKLSESTVSKILVIDERVQNQIGNTYYEKIYLHEVYAKSGIIIPETYLDIPFCNKDNSDISKSKFNLSASSMNAEFGKSLKDYIGYYLSIFKKTDFILIHYSILERIYDHENNNKKSKIEKINEYLNNMISDTSPQIVITSGRGTLKDLTPNVCFVNLSPVITAFVEIRSKYYSNYLLRSSRKSSSLI